MPEHVGQIPTTFYPEGATITRPSGAVYRRIGGNWVLIRYPDGTKTQYA